MAPPNAGICSTFSEFATFAEFPVFGSKKLNRWSAPRTRSERDADLHILAPTQGKTGIALKVLPKQAFFKDMRKKAPDSSSLPHFSAIRRPSLLKSWNFTTFSVQWHPQMLEFAAFLVQWGAQILEFAAPWVNFCNVWRQWRPHIVHWQLKTLDSHLFGAHCAEAYTSSLTVGTTFVDVKICGTTVSN